MPIIWLGLSIGGENLIFIENYNARIYYIEYLRQHDTMR